MCALTVYSTYWDSMTRLPAVEKQKIFHCVNINMIDISAGILLRSTISSWYVTGRGQCVCVRGGGDLMCVPNWDATQRYEGCIGTESTDTENFRSRNKLKKILYLLMPPSAESCPEGTLQVCVGKGQAERRGKPALSTLSKHLLQGAKFSELET